MMHNDAPLAALYHENSKISTASLPDLQDRIDDFVTDDNKLRRSMTSHKCYPTSRRIALAGLRPVSTPKTKLSEALNTRRTARQFRPDALNAGHLAWLLRSACGPTGTLTHPNDPDLRQALRPYPSGGALYPAEVYLAAHHVASLPPDIYHYCVPDDCLEFIAPADSMHSLPGCILTGEKWPAPGVTIIITLRWREVCRKYGERGYRIALLEAGHLAQNILLSATALCLGTLPVAGFHDDRLNTLLGLEPGEESAVYILLIGVV